MDQWNNSIRHVACELLIPQGVRCQRCMKYRGCLRVMTRRLGMRSSGRTDPQSCTPYSVLTSEEMHRRMTNLHTSLRNIRKKSDRLKEKLDRIVEKSGIQVSKGMSNDLRAIMEDEGRKAMESEHTTHFQRVFWQQQLLASSKNNACGMRWHPYMIKWCIYLRAHSQGAYETLRQSGCISLPSQRTLRDYTHHFKPKSRIFCGG